MSGRLLILIFLTLAFLFDKTASRLITFDYKNNEIGSFDQVDFMGLKRPNYGNVGGTLTFAKFIVDNSTRCKVQQLPEDVVILVIPLYEALNSGCESYADVLKSNSWTKEVQEESQGDSSPYSGTTHRSPATITSLEVSSIKSGDVITATHKSLEVITESDGSLTTSTLISVDVSTASSDFLSTSTFVTVQTPSDSVMAAPTGALNSQNTQQSPNTQEPGTQQAQQTQVQQTQAPNTQAPNTQAPNTQAPDTQASNNPVLPAVTDVLNSPVSAVSNVVSNVVPSVVSSVAAVVTPVVNSVAAAVTPVVSSVAQPIVSQVSQVAAPVVSQVPSILGGLFKRDLLDTAIPSVIIFGSSNDGVPGLNEPYNGDRSILDQSLPGLALLTYQDMINLQNISSKVKYANITADAGPWIELATSSPWILWSVAASISFFLVVSAALYFLSKAYLKMGFVMKNVKFWLYPGICFICLSAFILLVVDPGNIYEERLSILLHGFIFYFGHTLLMIFLAIVQISWKTAATNICKENKYHSNLAQRLNQICSYILIPCMMSLVTSFVLRMIFVSTSLSPWSSSFLKIGYFVECAALLFIGVDFNTFGCLMIIALRKRVFITSLHAKRQKSVLKISLIIVACSISIISCIAAESVSFLNPTIQNFWTQQTLHDASTVINCLVIILILQDETIGRHLPSTDKSLKIDSPSSETFTVSIKAPPNKDALQEQHTDTRLSANPTEEVEESEDDRSSRKIISSHSRNSITSNESTLQSTRPSDFLSQRPKSIGEYKNSNRRSMLSNTDSVYSRASASRKPEYDNPISEFVIIDNDLDDAGGETSNVEYSY